MMRRLVAHMPAPLARALARHAFALGVGLVLLVLLAGATLAALVSPGTLGLAAARVSDTRALPDAILSGGLAERDSDQDGLADSLENYLYGTDAEDWNSSGTGIPDGWLAEFGHDPLGPLLAQARGAAPPPDALPPAYADGYPEKFTPPLADYYRHGLPEAYRPGVDAPWWRGAARADPSRWDQAGSGIPTGWLLHYGLDVTRVAPDEPAAGSAGNLTLRQAFEHDADPRASDTDLDGLDDWTEIFATRTDPSRLSTAGTGIGDGWLLQFGLSPFDPDVASQDPDRDGLTNLEEYLHSAASLRDEAARDGPAVVWTKGLDPLDWQTARSGIPDGWFVRYGLDPFGKDLDRVIGRASDFAEVRDLDSAPQGFEPLPDFTMTLRDAYSYGRPTTWDEATMGVWWGGTDPATGDTDGDGLPDAVEIRGWYANVTFDAGPDAKARAYKATGNPLEPDSDGDGLTDGEEYRGRVVCAPGQPSRAFPWTDPRNRDTAFSGLTDLEKVCGAVRGETRYDLSADAGSDGPALDPTKADSAGDHMRDGARLDHWHARHQAYRANDGRYPYPGSAYATLYDWTETHARFAGLPRDEVLKEFRPDGDVDGDGIPNALDADPSGGLVADKLGAGTPKTKVFFPAGPEMDPGLYRFTEFASTAPRVASDPANPDTDGDGLPDAWEVRHGRFDPAKDGWDLDPAKRDSDGDGTTDDKANNDGDVVTWYAYDRRGEGIERTTRLWPFDNRLEYLAGTHPGETSTARDGVPDGWKAFWGSRVTDDTYPNLVSSRDARIGDLAMERVDEIEAALAQSPIHPLADLAGRESKAGGYVRFASAPLGADRATDRCASLLGQARPEAQEVALRERCFEDDTLAGTPLRILPIEGVHVVTYADEARLRTNPYLADSDGDGAPDAYESHHLGLVKGRTHPDPAVAEPAKDPDEDGLGLADECDARPLPGGLACGRHTFTREGRTYGAGADPHAADSDGDGIRDAIEATARLDPLDPSDLDGFRDPTRDADRDGVPDYQELTGWGKVAFGVTLRTDPQDPDTDGDSLLDGASLTLRPATDAARIAAWKALGMAHTTSPDGNVTFLGENTTYQATGSLPTTADSSGTGIPDAWFAYHLLDPREPGVDLAAYAAGRPSWWEEEKHGVWWWGRVPGADAQDADADGDGLHDLNGEDPFPGNFSNVLSRDGLTVTDLRDLEGFVQAARDPAETRARAQMAGESPGDPDAARGRTRVNADGVATRDDRARVAFVDVALGDGRAAARILTKGVPTTLTGRLVLDERDADGRLLQGTEAARLGVPNRAVLVSFFAPDVGKLVGAGFTDAAGRFSVPVNLTPELRVAIPQPGMALLGASKGFATARTDPGAIGAGDHTAGVRNALVVWTTNTSATVAPGHPTHGDYAAMLPDAWGTVAARTTHATRFAAAAPIPVTVRSDTRLTTTVAPVAENGGELVGDLLLTDTSGGALKEARVSLRWTGAATPIEQVRFTDRFGRVNLTDLHLPVSVQRADQHALAASFASADPDLRGANLTHAVLVRNPTALDASLQAEGATVGESLLVEGSLRTRDVDLATGLLRGGPVPDAEVRVVLGGVETAGRTDDQGRFGVRVIVPASLSAGAQSALVRFDGRDKEGPSQAALPIAIKRLSAITDLNRLEGARTGDATLRGRLLDDEGRGFVGDVEAFAGAIRLGGAKSDEEGRFAIPVRLGAMPLGPQPVRVAYGGDLAHAAAENVTQARVTSTTVLTLEGVPESLVRGQALQAKARLADDAGVPVARQAVHLFWRGERAATHVTDDQGAFTATVSTNLTERTGLTGLGLEYVPPPGSVLKGATAGAGVTVLAGSRLELASQNVTRGPVTVSGRLLDDEGRPLAGAPVALRFGAIDLGDVRTSRDGSFEASRLTPPGAELGPMPVAARYDGTAAIAGATAETTWTLRSPLRVDLTLLEPLVRGEKARLEARVTDDQGDPVDAPLSIDLAGRVLATPGTPDGRLRASLDVPGDAPRGAATLWLNATGTDRHEPLAKPIPVLVKIRPVVQVALPALAIRGFALEGGVTLRDDQGQPLRNTSFAYVLGEGTGPVTGRTDAEGRAVVASVAPITGEAVLSLTVRGGPDVVAADYTSPSLRVVGPATPVGYAVLLLAALAALALAGLVAAVVLLRRRQLREARAIVQEAIDRLLAGDEHQATIFLAYRRFSAHLARHGYAEKESQTPREFAGGVRKALPIPVAPLAELVRLFEEARYSDHALGARERDAAVESLALVRNEIDRILGGKAPAEASA